jgi:hypothetical protein
MVPTWKKDFDALVNETMVFAASVQTQHSVPPTPLDPSVTDATAPGANAEDEVVQADLGAPILATVEAVLAEEPTAPSPLPDAPSPIPAPKTMPARLPPMTVPPSERDLIKQRLENFKAHQQRTQAEREEYFARVLSQTRALIDGSPKAKAK